MNKNGERVKTRDLSYDVDLGYFRGCKNIIDEGLFFNNNGKGKTLRREGSLKSENRVGLLRQ